MKEEVRKRVQGDGVLRKTFSSFTRCSRRSFFCVDGVIGDEGHGVLFLLTLRRLQRYFFLYSSSKFSTSCLNAFCCVLFVLAVFYGN